LLKQTKHILTLSFCGLTASYAQVFFSNSRAFGALLMLVTFADVGVGLSGIGAVLLVQLTALLFNFNEQLIKDGAYTYNALMVGLALGGIYELNLSLALVLTSVSILTFFITLWFMNVLGAKALPYLSIPFLLGVWVILLGAGNFTALELHDKGVFSMSEWWPGLYSGTTEFIGTLPFHNAIFLYLRSLGAILFQYSDVAGIIISIGLILHSRISFVLSIFGFTIGYLFYHYMEGDFSQLIYSYIGFNFILTAIALGGFFVVPSRRSFAQLIFTIPLITLLISALHSLFSIFELPLYSLPFNIVVLLFLSAMYLRSKSSGLNLVTIQQFSPEKHHYSYTDNLERFRRDTYVHIALPIIGEWNVSQGYDGEITHRGEWKHAWDFDVRDIDGSTYQMPGGKKEDFFCFDLPVIAPADGKVVKVEKGIHDNEVGNVNLEDNWGNAVVIKHGDHLYSKFSHLKKNTLKLEVGDTVKKGEVIAKCGSSGRSPEPHLHFQLQSTPYIGSKTLYHPISYFVSKKNGKNTFHAFEIPKEGETVCNMKTTKALTKAFSFIPGKKFNIESTENDKTETWEVLSSYTNETYIWCPTSGSTAWFKNNNNVFYFTAFKGNKSSSLYKFFLGAYKVPLGYYEEMALKDNMNIMSVVNPFIRFIHDFTAPFFHYIKARYSFRFTETDNEHDPYIIQFESQITESVFGLKRATSKFHIKLWDNKIALTFETKNKKHTITCVPIS